MASVLAMVSRCCDGRTEPEQWWIARSALQPGRETFERGGVPSRDKFYTGTRATYIRFFSFSRGELNSKTHVVGNADSGHYPNS